MTRRHGKTRSNPRGGRRLWMWTGLLLVVLSLDPAAAQIAELADITGTAWKVLRTNPLPRRVLLVEEDGASLRGEGWKATPKGRPGDGTAVSSNRSAPPSGGLARFWWRVRRTALARRVSDVGSWVVGAARVLWAIPKAVVKGDSRGLIEAIGDLLSRASPEADAKTAGPPGRLRNENLPGEADSSHVPPALD